MADITLPTIEPGDTLTEPVLIGPVEDALDVLQEIDGDNLAPESIGRHHFDCFDDGTLARYQDDVQNTTHGVYSTTTPVFLSHGGKNSYTTFSPAVGVTAGSLIRCHLFAHVRLIETFDDTNTGEDMYFFKPYLELPGGGELTLDAPWFGFSMLVRNSDGTLTDDTPINTDNWDPLSLYHNRHVDLTWVYVVPEDTELTVNLAKMGWKFKMQTTDHEIQIGEFAVAFYIFEA